MDWFLFYVLTATSLIYAFWDHAETLATAREAIGRKAKIKAWSKLFLLWFVPVISAIGSYLSTVSGEEVTETLRKHETSVAEAKKQAAKSNAKAATLSKDLDLERLKLEQIKDKLRFRNISTKQRAGILELLLGFPKGPVSISVIETDLEAVAFAKQIESVLTSAGFSVDLQTAMMMSGPNGAPVGLVFCVENQTSVPRHADRILNAFAKVGLNPTPAIGGEADALKIIVGAKPPEP